MSETTNRNSIAEDLHFLSESITKGTTENEFIQLNQLLASLGISMNFENSFKILDILLEKHLTDSPKRIELIAIFLSYVRNFTCQEKSTILEKLYSRLAAISNKDIGALLFSIYDVLATALRIQCPSLIVNLTEISGLVDSALGCLQSKTIPTSSSHAQSVLDFILALCGASCDSFAWINQMTPRCPDGLPFRLLLLVIEIELKLRLPANLGGYHQVKTSDEKMLCTCLDLLSLLIAEISVSSNDFDGNTNDGVVGSMSDDSLITIMNQLIELGELMATSLAPDQDPPAPTDVPAITASSTAIQTSPLLLHALSVYLQWMSFSYKDQFLGITVDSISDFAHFDHILFQAPLPETKEYKALAKRFEEKVWKPLSPLMDSIIPMVFRLTNDQDSNHKWLTLCRKFLLRLARLFPAVVLSSFNCEFYDCLLAKCSTEEEDILKSPSGLTYLTDLSALLDVTMKISSLGTSSAGNLGDVYVGVVGRLFSLLCRADWGSSMWKFLVFDSGDENLCKECRNRMCIQLLERFFDSLALLRFLVVNLWQEEMAFCLRVAELNTLDEIGEKREPDPKKWLVGALLTFLRLLAGLEPSSLLDWELSNQLDPLLRGFYAPCTLRQSAEALFQCCHSCQGSEFCKRLRRKPEFKELEAKICPAD